MFDVRHWTFDVASPPAMDLARLFPDADYRHHLSVKRGNLAAFFAPVPKEHDEVIGERNRWLDESPQAYAAAVDSSVPIIEEAATAICDSDATSRANTALGAVVDVGRRAEPDIVLLEKNGDGAFRVVAGCVCFPSSWSFPEKLGLPLDSVHSVVPDLNSAIGAPIARFLNKIQPGASWERSNWGLSASPERNQHPSRRIPRIALPVALDRVWLRVEDQILSVLPETNALLFGIRIVTCPLDELQSTQPEAAAGLRRALETLPEAMAHYKNIAAVRTALVDML
jgi:hypothetical protein